MSSAANSIVWNYFKKIDMRSVSCNLCGKTYKTSGNTTNLATHLKNKHHNAYAQLNIESKDKKNKNGQTIVARATSTSDTCDNDSGMVTTVSEEFNFCKTVDNEDRMSISNISNLSVDESPSRNRSIFETPCITINFASFILFYKIQKMPHDIPWFCVQRNSENIKFPEFSKKSDFRGVQISYKAIFR